MDLMRFLGKRQKHVRKAVDQVKSIKFSDPITVYVNLIKSIEPSDKFNGMPMVNIEITPRKIECLKDAVDLNKKVVRSVERRLHPQVGDIIPILDDDPTDIFLQVLFELVGRGKI